jgi:flagellar FliL protein
MAQEPAKAEVAVAVPNSKKKMIIIAAIILALIAAGGSAAFFMMQKKDNTHQSKGKTAEEGEESADEDAEHEEAANGHSDPKMALTYVQFETFTVNLLPDPEDKFLQLDLTIEVRGVELAEKMKSQMPLLRNRVLLLLTSKKASDIATPEGKAQLSEELLAELKKPLTARGKPVKVTQVLFTSFVIQ